MAEYIVKESGYPGRLETENVGELIRCKDCKYFKYDCAYIIHGVPVLGHLVCTRWGDGCRTDEEGFCFMAERKEGEAE